MKEELKTKRFLETVKKEKDPLKILKLVESVQERSIANGWICTGCPDIDCSHEHYVYTHLWGTGRLIRFWETKDTSNRPSPEFVLVIISPSFSKVVRIGARNYPAWQKARRLLQKFCEQG